MPTGADCRCTVMRRREWVLGLLVLALSGAGPEPLSASVPGSAHSPQTLLAAGTRLLVLPAAGREEGLAALHRAFQARVLHQLDRCGGWQVVELPAQADAGKVLEAYRSHPAVQFAELDARIEMAQTLPNDPFFQNGAQWHLNNYGQNNGVADADLDAPEAWDVVREAPGVIVAILDSGIRWTHEDLRDNLWRNPKDQSPGLNVVGRNHDPWDDNGHGTHVAGLIGAVGNNQRGVVGVAWRIRLMAVKVLDSAGYGWFGDAMIGLEFALTNGARVINISWTSSTNSMAFSNLLWQAGQTGAVVVAAAGNSPVNLDVFPAWPASLGLPHQLTVAASTRTDQRHLQSAYGPSSVHLYAPGAGLYSTAATGDAAYVSLSGTSMAAAVTSGAVALMRQRFPAAGPEEVVARLLAAVDIRPAFVGWSRSGGRLNLRKAVDLPRLSIGPGLPARIRLFGYRGHPYVLQASSNLTLWSPLATNVLETEYWDWADPEAGESPMRFYRALPAP